MMLSYKLYAHSYNKVSKLKRKWHRRHLCHIRLVTRMTCYITPYHNILHHRYTILYPQSRYYQMGWNTIGSYSNSHYITQQTHIILFLNKLIQWISLMSEQSLSSDSYWNLLNPRWFFSTTSELKTINNVLCTWVLWLSIMQCNKCLTIVM